MRRIYLLVLFLYLLASTLAAQRLMISGQVIDMDTREPLREANIYLHQHRQGQTTDKDGCFKFFLPQQQQIKLRVSYVGYTSQYFEFVLLKDTTINVALRQENQLSELLVHASKRNFSVESSQMSAVEIPLTQIRQVPALFGEVDVLKALQKLPGVQSSNDGQAGIYVRGGNYDQNQITLDGSPLYNAEHLKGFVSAINPDMVENVTFYKGAFPARYGGQLSSVVNVEMKEGDLENYHTELMAGMLSSKVHVEGPIQKGKTSFNISGRMSYFDAIVQPLMESIADNKNSTSPYANVNYYDISAKLVHHLSDIHKLSLFLYWGKDKNNSAPTDSRQVYQTTSGEVETTYDNTRKNATDNSWGNLISALCWKYKPDTDWSMNTNLTYSHYQYKLKYSADIINRTDEADKMVRYYSEKSYSIYHSELDEMALHVDFQRTWREKHSLRWGIKPSIYGFLPTVDVDKNVYNKVWISDGYKETKTVTDSVLGKKMIMFAAAVYAEDDWELNRYLKINGGVRYSLFHASGKSYHSLEPRLSLRWLFRKEMSFKLSYARMAQGIHLLSSSNLIMPSDIWVPTTKDIPLMKSSQWAIGYHYEISKGLDFSLEGYYKTMDNLLEYKEGSSYTNTTGDWQQLVTLGQGKAYGAELLLQKNTGKTTGWLSYTWSKALRTFDELNGGHTYYAGNDRRHNFNIVLAHRFNRHWEGTISWTYQTGQRGILSTTALYGGHVDEYDPFTTFISSSSGDSWGTSIPIYFRKYTRFYTYGERNSYVLPAIHRLDVGVTYTFKHDGGESQINFSIYNAYNQQNISNVYIGYENSKTVLKGVCLLPFMPSISYTLKF